ncbi:MAG: error-prone DNA polymerase [Planctomycetota bacterium]|nr:error-prone DNA polymerase [Planctomycetota bacterium]
MPAVEFPKLRPHPFRRTEPLASDVASPDTTSEFAELCVTSNFTFLTGASHPEECVAQARSLGYRAIGICDLHSLAGIVRAHVAARDAGMQLVIGARVRPLDMPQWEILLYPESMSGYRNLCRLLTTGKRRASKGQCHLEFNDIAGLSRELLAIAMPLDEDVPMALASPEAIALLRRMRDVFDDDRLSLATSIGYGPDDGERLARTAEVSRQTGVPLVATNRPLSHHPDRRMLQDVVTCIRHGCTLAQAGLRLNANAERHLKHPDEMQRLFAAYPEAMTRTLRIAERCRGFTLDQLKYEYPDEVVPVGTTPQQHLTDLAWRGAHERYGAVVPEKVCTLLRHELKLIEELNYAPYFLTVHDLVRFARTGEETPGATPIAGWQGPILCQGRGAAANSAVCFCLGVTAVDPTRIDMLFERFVSKERNEPPDIDIDFEHERREEVIQYIYRKYGRERAALTAEVISYRRRSAVREVGKVLGLSLDLVDRLAKDIEWFDHGIADAKRLREMGLNPDDHTLHWLVTLSSQLLGFPRHLSQHVGGFIITRSPLCELVPVENAAMPDRTVVEWDKDDIDAAGMLKVDVLGLGMLTALRRCMATVNARRREEGKSELSLATIPAEDPATYAMIQRADTVGVFQIESRAQMSMLPRLKPRNFYDLVIEVAIVRPGPIQGGMVHPYLRRRDGIEKPEYVHPSIEEVLKKTLGVPLFQEQCMALAVKAAGFTPGEADQLRRAMAAWKRKGDQIYRFGQMLIDGMTRNGIPEEFARRCFDQIKGFSEYGFPESHAASFALLVYASAWLKRHEPAHFCAALLNSQPMGFYAPAQLVRDAKEHGIGVLPIDVNHSTWESMIERGQIRLGMSLVMGLQRPEAERLARSVREHGRFTSMQTLWRASGVRAATLRRLAAADAFGSMGLSRQQALWQTRLLRDDPMPLFEGVLEDTAANAKASVPETHADGLDALPTLTPSRHVVLDYNTTGLSLKAHPVSFAREALSRAGAVPCAALSDAGALPDGAKVRVAGLVLVRQRPGTAKEVTFMTLEDESGIANLVVWHRVYQRFRRAAAKTFVLATGVVQRAGGVVHVIVHRLDTPELPAEPAAMQARNFH